MQFDSRASKILKSLGVNLNSNEQKKEPLAGDRIFKSLGANLSSNESDDEFLKNHKIFQVFKISREQFINNVELIQECRKAIFYLIKEFEVSIGSSVSMDFKFFTSENLKNNLTLVFQKLEKEGILECKNGNWYLTEFGYNEINNEF